MPTILLNMSFICIISLEEERNQFNITIMSCKIHNFQGLVVANHPGKLSKNLNATKM